MFGNAFGWPHLLIMLAVLVVLAAIVVGVVALVRYLGRTSGPSDRPTPPAQQ